MIYMAPEVNKLTSGSGQSYDPRTADMYSLGVCLHVMLFAEYPQTNDGEYFAQPTDCGMGSFTPSDIKPGFDLSKYEGVVSQECLEVLESLLSEKPDQRLSAEQLLSSPWLSQVYGSQLDIDEIIGEMNN